MKRFGFTGNQLKIFALICMTVDHIGVILLPQSLLLRIIGRLAFPIFGYMIAEGCRYTRSMGRYLGLLVGFAAVSQMVDYVATGSLYQCIFVTFSMSVVLIWLLQLAIEKKKKWAWLAAAAALIGVFFLTRVLPVLLSGTDYDVDYGFWGVMLPVVIYFGKDRWRKLGFAAVVLLLLARESHWIQYIALLTLPLLALYNGQRGKWKMKYLFYIYYPVHLAVLHLISII